MTGIALIPTIAHESTTCWVCVGTLGLPPFGIQAGEVVIQFEAPGGTYYACVDCYQRLWEEITSTGNSGVESKE